MSSATRTEDANFLPAFPPWSYRFIPDFVAWLFGIYGYAIGRKPWIFLAFGLFCSLAASLGCFNLEFASDDSAGLAAQFLEDRSRYVEDDTKVKSWISRATSKSSNRSRRQSDLCDHEIYGHTWRVASIMVVANEDNILTVETFQEILRLTRLIRRTLHCGVEEESFCCDAWDLYRFQRELLPHKIITFELTKQMVDFMASLTYPADEEFTLSTALANFLGGVSTRDSENLFNSKISTVKAMMFQYMLPPTEEAIKFENELTKQLKNPKFEHFRVYWQTWLQLEHEFNQEVVREVPKVALTFICVIFWCITGSLHVDAVRSKPWCAVLGICCTALACMSGFGIQFWQGSVFHTYLIAVPLMSLAIGLDDMFILMTNWHRTDINWPRERRAMVMLKEGGTSIFVTALMTIIDFIIGTSTPYPAITTFSKFALWCLLFDFILQMTVFVSILVLTDSQEKRHEHSCLCHQSLSLRSQKYLQKMSTSRLICCTYTNVTSSDDLGKSEKFLYDYVAPIVLKPSFRTAVAVFILIFISCSLTLIFTRIEIGFRPEQLANRLSNTYDFNVMSWKYFRNFIESQRLEIVFEISTSDFDRNFSKIHQTCTEIVERIEHSNSFIWDKRLNKVTIRDISLAHFRDLPLPIAVEMLSNLESSVAHKPALLGNEDSNERLIFLATFYVRNITTLQRGADLIKVIKNIQSTYEDSGSIRLYTTDSEQALRIYDQIGNLPKQLVYFTLITLASTVVASFIMIPHPICMFWLAFSSLCVIIGTVAGMALWNVSLDPVSLIYLLMAIGSTADYICHSIYMFTILEPNMPEENWPEQKIRYAKSRRLIAYVIYETLPAVLGTLLSIVVLSTTQVYVLQAFFKVFFISVVVAFFFMAVILPVALCQFGPAGKTLPKSQKRGNNKRKSTSLLETSTTKEIIVLTCSAPKQVSRTRGMTSWKKAALERFLRDSENLHACSKTGSIISLTTSKTQSSDQIESVDNLPSRYIERKKQPQFHSQSILKGMKSNRRSVMFQK